MHLWRDCCETRKTALLAVWGTAKATATPTYVLGKVRIAQPRGGSQGEGCGVVHSAPPARKSSGAREKASMRPRKATSAARQAKTPQREKRKNLDYVYTSFEI